ncbi:MAG: mannose-6-phosphate isomerase, class I [Actinomycetales bacterium]|nr:mannose-6-phosphate isomerase, class I [Actinomycetales bacterium]
MFALLTNTPRDYAWGSRAAIAELLGRPASGGPEAELWLGTHPGSPARLVDGGATLLETLDAPLPYLLKVLAAAEPLSLQAHPTPEQAAEGFAREEAAGVPLDAPQRNYKDRGAKPELIYALSDPFRALSGFRPVADTLAVLDPVRDDPRIAPLVGRLGGDGALRAVVRWLLERGEGVEELVAAVVEAAAVVEGPSWETVRLLAGRYPGDPGIAISLLLHTVALRPGEALYLPAGNIHAYLEGLGIELMAASDNVLRGGLTPKHVDLPELLRVLDVRPLPVPYLVPEEREPGVRVFRPEGVGFALTVVDAAALARGVELPAPGRSLALAVGGAVEIGADEVPAGSAAYLSGESPLAVRGRGTLFLASA